MNMRWFSDNELKAIDDFITKHISELNCYKNNNPNHVSDGFIINLNCTGLGIATNITCKCCGEKEDITDYDVW